MLPRSLRCLCLCMAVLITVSVDQSGCHQPFSRRGTPSFSAFSHHRFARRSSPRLSNHLHRRSIAINETPSPTGPVSHSKRSIDLYQLDTDPSSQSLDQQRNDAEQMWEEFVESTDGEDLDSYLDCDDEDESGFNTASLGSNDTPPAQTLSSSSASPANTKSTTSNSQNQKPSQVQKVGSSSNYDEDEVKSGNQDELAKEAARKKELEKAKKEKAAAAAKAQQHDADEEAQAKKEQEAADAKKQHEAADAAKKQEEATKKQEEAAKKQQEAEQAKKDQEAAEAAEKAKQDKEAYAVTNIKKIPGTSVTTGTVHKPKDETYSSPPSSEEHSGDATFFTPDTGACGVVNTPSDYIVAVSHLLYDSFPSQGGNPNTNAICGKKIRAHYNGRSVEVTVTDRCEGCDMYSLDFTESAFQQLGSKEEGRLHGMTWTFV